MSKYTPDNENSNSSMWIQYEIKNCTIDIDYTDERKKVKVYLSSDRNKIGIYSYELYYRKQNYKDIDLIKIFEENNEIFKYEYLPCKYKGYKLHEPILCGDGKNRDSTFFLIYEKEFDENGEIKSHKNKDGYLINMYNMIGQKIGEYCFGSFYYTILISLNQDYFLACTCEMSSWSYFSGIIDKNKLLHDQKETPISSAIILTDDIKDKNGNIDINYGINCITSYLKCKSIGMGRYYNNARYSITFYKRQIEEFKETEVVVNSKYIEDSDIEDSDIEEIEGESISLTYTQFLKDLEN